jgi:N-terminal domain of anti-restriction factor ArdC
VDHPIASVHLAAAATVIAIPAYVERLRLSEPDGFQTLTTSDGWKQMLRMASHLHTYSLRNQLLIAAQMPTATAVAGYRQWQRLGRQVRKGSEAIWVLGPVTYKSGEEVNEATGESHPLYQLRGFKPLAVFDISDTEGPELPKPAHLSGEAPKELWDGLTRLLGEQGYTVERVELIGGKQGSTSPTDHKVRIDSRLSPMEALAVLAHEHAHVALGHLEQIDEYRQHRGPFEVEAESAVFVTMTALGFDTGNWSVDYVAGWAGDSPEAMAKTAERVISTAHETLDRLSPDHGLDVSSGIGLTA